MKVSTVTVQVTDLEGLPVAEHVRGDLWRLSCGQTLHVEGRLDDLRSWAASLAAGLVLRDDEPEAAPVTRLTPEAAESWSDEVTWSDVEAGDRVRLCGDWHTVRNVKRSTFRLGMLAVFVSPHVDGRAVVYAEPADAVRVEFPRRVAA